MKTNEQQVMEAQQKVPILLQATPPRWRRGGFPNLLAQVVFGAYRSTGRLSACRHVLPAAPFLVARHGHRDVLNAKAIGYILTAAFFVICTAQYNDKHCVYYGIRGCWRWGGQASSSIFPRVAYGTAGTRSASLWFAG